MAFPTKDGLERTKLSLEILTYAGAVAAIAVFVLNPGVVGAWLKSLGVSSLSTPLGDVKFAEDAVRASTDKLAISRDATAELQARLDVTTKALECERSADCTPAPATPSTAAIVAGNIAAYKTATQVVSALNTQVQRNETALAKITPAPSVTGQWLVVVGAEPTAAAAEFERQKLARTYPQAKVIQRDGFYRTVIPFDTTTEARAANAAIEKSTGTVPYIRSEADWCGRATNGRCD